MLLQNPNVKPVDQDSLKSSLVSLNRERNKTFAVSCLPSVKMIRSKAMDHERPNSFYSHGAGYRPEENWPRRVERWRTEKRTGKTKHVNNKNYENTLVLCPFERTENKISANFN